MRETHLGKERKKRTKQKKKIFTKLLNCGQNKNYTQLYYLYLSNYMKINI